MFESQKAMNIEKHKSSTLGYSITLGYIENLKIIKLNFKTFTIL